MILLVMTTDVIVINQIEIRSRRNHIRIIVIIIARMMITAVMKMMDVGDVVRENKQHIRTHISIEILVFHRFVAWENHSSTILVLIIDYLRNLPPNDAFHNSTIPSRSDCSLVDTVAIRWQEMQVIIVLLVVMLRSHCTIVINVMENLDVIKQIKNVVLIDVTMIEETTTRLNALN